VAINVPRLDYTGGGCPKILVEPARTNLVLQSQTLENASWSKTIGGTGIAPVVTANAGTAPDGTMTADRVQFNCVGSLSADRSILLQGSLVTTITTRYYQSIYVKAFSSGEVGKQLRIASDGLTGVSQVITLTADWQRIVLNGLASGVTTNFIVETRGTFTTPTNTTADVLLWGAQIEAGSNATSYIPTTTLVAGTTRTADVISKTGISSLIGQTEGTIFMDLNFTNVGVDKYILVINNTANTNSIAIRRLSGGAIRIILTATTTSGTTSQSSAVLANGNYKIAYRYISGSIKLYINGALSFSETPTFTFGAAIENIKLGMSNGNTEQLNDSINSFQLYQTALTHDQCIDLTN
jgi:hypothetical protein